MKGVLVIVGIVMMSFYSLAQESIERPFHKKREGHHEVHNNNFEAFLGGTKFTNATLLTVGFDYEHRFKFAHQHFGTGLLFDYEFGRGEHRSEWLLTPTVFYFPSPHWKLFGGYGMAHFITNQNSEDLHHYSKQSYALLRLGGGFEMDLGDHIILSPSVYMDYTSVYWAAVFGLGIGLGY